MSGSISTRFDGRVALITGAGRGIGRAVALELAAGGTRVASLPARSTSSKEPPRPCGQRAGTRWCPVDLADTPVIAEVAARAIKELGPVDILINRGGGPARRTDPHRRA